LLWCVRVVCAGVCWLGRVVGFVALLAFAFSCFFLSAFVLFPSFRFGEFSSLLGLGFNGVTVGGVNDIFEGFVGCGI
jgi:hypothetical protein